MVSSYCCICNKKRRSKSVEFIKYKNETVFKVYEGINIYKCLKCGVLKTFSNKIAPKQSRIDLYEDNMAKFKKILGFLVKQVQKYKKSGNVLDIGCSSGILLELLKSVGYKTFGIEPNKQAYLKAKEKFGSYIFQGTLDKFIQKNKTKFDVIIYNHVLEHIYDPRHELEIVRNILKKEGIIILGLPNTANLIFYLRGKYWESLMPREHIWHFSKGQIKIFLNSLNFEVIKTYYSNHDRSDYPLLKKLYFSILSILSRLFNTGEAMLIIAKHK